MPGAPEAAGTIFTRSSACWTPRGRERMRVGERVQEHGGEVAVDHRRAVLRPAAGRGFEPVEELPGPPGSPSSYWSSPVQPTIACHITGLIHAFSNAVPMKRGGSHPSSRSAGLTCTRPNPKPQCTSAVGVRVAHPPHRLADVLRGLGDALLRHDADPVRGHALRKFRAYDSPISEPSMSTPTSVSPRSASSFAQ